MNATTKDALNALDGCSTVLVTNSRILAAGGVSPSVLVAGERIVAVGDAARARAAAAAGTVHTIELPGLTVVPGFIDAHTHLVHVGFGLMRPDLSGLPSAAAVVAHVREVLAGHDPSRPLIGERWDDGRWGPGDRIGRADLDRIAARTPVILRRVCGHKAVANSAALAALLSDKRGAAYAAQGFVDETTGILVEDAAMRLAALFPPAAAEIEQALALACSAAGRLGVTAAHDMVTPGTLRALQVLKARGHLTLRVTAHLAHDQLAAAEEIGLMSGLGDNWLRLGGVKLFLDGSLGARTAALRTPYADRPGTTGLLLIAEEEVNALTRRLDRRGLTAVIHAIGDRAIAVALAALEALGPAAVRTLRHRIEHLELTPDDLLARMAQVGATASMQPNFVARWGEPGGMYEQALGPTRYRAMNRFKSLAERGVPLAFGSDSMPMGPVAGLAGAVAHPVERERLTPAAALTAYAQGAAHAAFTENELGSIAPGKLADLVVLAGDPLDADELPACRVAATIVGGRAVFTDDELMARTLATAD